jgi:hypothetical protein
MDSWSPPNIACFGNYGMDSTWTPPGLSLSPGGVQMEYNKNQFVTHMPHGYTELTVTG